MSNSDLLEELRGRELRGGGWSFFGSRQVSLEATSLASLCLLAESPSEALRLGKLLSGVQLADGSWPSFVGDWESSWTTALAVCALNSVNDPSKARERGESWLLRTKGREGHWFWRWKFKTADRNVQLRSRQVRLALDFGLRQLGHPHSLQHHRHQAIHRLQSLRGVGETNPSGRRYASGSCVHRRRLELWK